MWVIQIIGSDLAVKLLLMKADILITDPWIDNVEPRPSLRENTPK